MQKHLLPALTVLCLATCTSTTTNSNLKNAKAAAPPATEVERIIVIPPIKDTSSIQGHLRPLTAHKIVLPSIPGLLPDSLRDKLAKGPMTMEYTSDTMKLHIKGDSCWIEYVCAGRVYTKKKDGTIAEGPASVNETTDKVWIK